jgi:hypothetical protein
MEEAHMDRMDTSRARCEALERRTRLVARRRRGWRGLAGVWVALGLALGLLLLPAVAWAQAAQSEKGSANFAQSEAGASNSWHCPAEAGGGPFVEVPDMAVSLTTDGGPVLMMAMLNVVSNSELTIRPVIDGAANPEEAVGWLTESTVIDVLGLHRIYTLPAGVHTIGIEASCAPPDVFIRGRRLSVYELPLLKK